MFYDDYQTEPIGGTNPYHRCVYCKRSVPELNGTLENHEPHCKYRQMKEREIALATWSKEWPKEEGSYWLYGKLWSDDKEDAIHLVEVWQVSNGVTYVSRGSFVSKSEGLSGVWLPVQFPDPPVV